MLKGLKTFFQVTLFLKIDAIFWGVCSFFAAEIKVFYIENWFNVFLYGKRQYLFFKCCSDNRDYFDNPLIGFPKGFTTVLTAATFSRNKIMDLEYFQENCLNCFFFTLKINLISEIVPFRFFQF